MQVCTPALHTIGSDVQALMRSEPNVDLQSTYGYTALHEAACMGHTAVMKTLLAYGANMNRQARAPPGR